MASSFEISPNDLWTLIGTPNAPTIIDVSLNKDVDADPYLVPSAKRISHRQVEQADNVRSCSSYVCVCQKGLKLSHGAAALLRTRGISALALRGGNFGWRDAGFPRIAIAKSPRTSLFVSPDDPIPSELATIWFLIRFVRRDLRIIFVARTMVKDVADRFEGSYLQQFGRSPVEIADAFDFKNVLLHVPFFSERPVSCDLQGVLGAMQSSAGPLNPGILSVFDALYSLAQTERAAS